MEIIEQIGSYAGLAAIVGLAVLSALYFSQARDVKRLREWAGRAPERAAQPVHPRSPSGSWRSLRPSRQAPRPRCPRRPVRRFRSSRARHHRRLRDRPRRPPLPPRQWQQRPERSPPRPCAAARHGRSAPAGPGAATPAGQGKQGPADGGTPAARGRRPGKAPPSQARPRAPARQGTAPPAPAESIPRPGDTQAPPPTSPPPATASCGRAIRGSPRHARGTGAPDSAHPATLLPPRSSGAAHPAAHRDHPAELRQRAREGGLTRSRIVVLPWPACSCSAAARRSPSRS